jgi:hypothetical protein
MIFLVFVMIWLGRRRGMNYWNWVGVYLALSIVNTVVVFTTHGNVLNVITSAICLLWLVIFFIWPLIASSEQKQEMEKMKVEYQNEEGKVDQFIQDKMKDWVAIKVYTDQTDTIEFHKDKETLEALKIPSIAKSTFGITTISVLPDRISDACAALKIDAPLDEDGKLA